MSLSENRHHEKRIKRKVSSYNTAGDKSPRAVGIAARSKAMCSCAACGNQSKHEGDKPKYKSIFQLDMIDRRKYI